MSDAYAHLSTLELSRRARALHAACEWPDIELPAFMLKGLLIRNRDRRAQAADIETEIARREAAKKETVRHE